MYLHRLVYYSENKIREIGGQLAKELKAILAAGHRNNPPAGITGALVFNEHYFVGVLEGDRRRVSTALLRIAADPRNANVTILDARAVGERRFDEWSSVYAGHSETVDRLYLRYGLTHGLDPGRMSAESMLALVEAMTRLDAHHLAAHGPGAGHENVEVIHVTPVLHGPA
jgi:hypothetical protein